MEDSYKDFSPGFGDLNKTMTLRKDKNPSSTNKNKVARMIVKEKTDLCNILYIPKSYGYYNKLSSSYISNVKYTSAEHKSSNLHCKNCQNDKIIPNLPLNNNCSICIWVIIS